MSKIMERPNIPGASENCFLGEQLKRFFFNKGERYIPKELIDWEPDDDQEYRCLYMEEDGEVVLKYVDADTGDTGKVKRSVLERINNTLKSLSIKDLKEIDEYIVKRYR